MKGAGGGGNNDVPGTHFSHFYLVKKYCLRFNVSFFFSNFKKGEPNTNPRSNHCSNFNDYDEIPCHGIKNKVSGDPGVSQLSTRDSDLQMLYSLDEKPSEIETIPFTEGSVPESINKKPKKSKKSIPKVVKQHTMTFDEMIPPFYDPDAISVQDTKNFVIGYAKSKSAQARNKTKSPDHEFQSLEKIDTSSLRSTKSELDISDMRTENINNMNKFQTSNITFTIDFASCSSFR